MKNGKQKHGDHVQEMVQNAVAKAFEELSKSIAEIPDKILEYSASDEAVASVGHALGAPRAGAPAGKKPKVIKVPAGTLSKEGGHVYNINAGQSGGAGVEGSIPLLDDETYLERAESPWQGGIVKVRGKNVSGAYQTMANLVQGSNFVKNFLSNNPQPTNKKIV